MISVLTVNYHSSEDLKSLADSLRQHAAGRDLELIVTNNSQDDPVDLPSDPAMKVVVHNAPNVGYAAGINRGYRQAQGEILFIANPDIRVTAGVLDHAACYLADHPDVGILLPRLSYPNGDLQRSIRRFYTWPVILYARSPLRALGIHPPFFRRYLYEDVPADKPVDVDWGLGGALFLRKQDCDMQGIFDERFFMYFEDVDLCYRFWLRRRRVVYDPSIECHHHHRRHSRNPLSTAGWHHFRSLLRFIAKYGGLPQRPLL